MGKKKIKEQSKEELVTEAKELAAAAAKSSQPSKSKKIDEGKVYINASYNNTVVTVTDNAGNVLAWASAGSLGFSGPKKATPFASSKVVAAIAEKVKSVGPRAVEILVKGVGGGRDSAIRSIINQGFDVLSIKDVTPIPHNGPRPRKVRRV
ncbi:MAG: 30S ribosomal protein S11 [Candidatus Liptonbacteria bacterium]|nr:30S ribosomal protein S11 [Candidatus Liptonbacteria bacterium]